MTLSFFSKKLYFIIFIVLVLQSCSSVTTKTKQQDLDDIIYMPGEKMLRKKAEKKPGRFLNELFSNKAKNTKTSQLSINPFLWQASLDILSSTVPLASVDSNSGIIISDWYNVKNKTNERIKISVLINTQELRADGIKVSIFKQILKSNTWNNTKVDPVITQKIERKILKRAGSLANSNY